MGAYAKRIDSFDLEQICHSVEPAAMLALWRHNQGSTLRRVNANSVYRAIFIIEMLSLLIFVEGQCASGVP